MHVTADLTTQSKHFIQYKHYYKNMTNLSHIQAQMKLIFFKDCIAQDQSSTNPVITKFVQNLCVTMALKPKLKLILL